MPSLPETMTAAVYRGRNDLRLEQLPVPKIGPGEVLIKVSACGVCGTDLKKIHHGLQDPPRIYGHETVGSIAQVGEGVTDWQVGQRVAVYHHIPCGTCQYCQRGVPSQCAVYKRTGVTAGFEPAGGGYAEYVRVMDWIVSGGGLVAVPDDVTDAEATFVEPVNTCLKGVARADLHEGDLAYVIGCGPIGLLLSQLCLTRGVKVVAADLLAGRRAVAARFGATAVEPAGVREAILAGTDGRGADAVFIAVPLTSVIQDALSLTRAGGRVVLFAHTRLDDPFTADAGEVCSLDKAILGSYSSDVMLNDEASEVVFSRSIDVASLVTSSYPLAQITAAVARASEASDDNLKVIVTL